MVYRQSSCNNSFCFEGEKANYILVKGNISLLCIFFHTRLIITQENGLAFSTSAPGIALKCEAFCNYYYRKRKRYGPYFAFA